MAMLRRRKSFLKSSYTVAYGWHTFTYSNEKHLLIQHIVFSIVDMSMMHDTFFHSAPDPAMSH